MALYRLQLIFNMEDGLPDNAATNTLYFDADAEVDLPLIETEVTAFYGLFDGILSSLIDTDNIVMQWYRLSDPTPRQVIRTANLTGLVNATTAGPTEVALVLSYQGAKISGLPQNRRRGRIFIGPLEAADEARPTDAQIATISAAGQNLLNASDAATTWTWAQWSETNGVGIDVANGWCDNEWDTQRRRGREATKRDTFGVL